MVPPWSPMNHDTLVPPWSPMNHDTPIWIHDTSIEKDIIHIVLVSMVILESSMIQASIEKDIREGYYVLWSPMNHDTP
jgi:hypothetical protein